VVGPYEFAAVDVDIVLFDVYFEYPVFWVLEHCWDVYCYVWVCWRGYGLWQVCVVGGCFLVVYG